MALTTPTYSAGSWYTEHSADIELVMRQIIDVNKIATPTLQILMDNRGTEELGPEGKIGRNFEHNLPDEHVGAPNQVYSFEAIEHLSRMEYSTVLWYEAASINEQEKTRYGRRNRSLIDLVDIKVKAMHRSLTHAMNYKLWSKWAETLAGDEIDVETELNDLPLPPPMKIREVQNHTDRIYSIPMCIRDHNTGHTFGNVSSANAFWRSTVSEGGGLTRSAAGDNIDLATTITAAATVELGVTDITDHLSAVQTGGGYRLYAACPSALYGVLRDYLVAERRREPDEMLADLGINAYFTYEEFNTVFYMDPILNALWPYSIWFYDTECMQLVFDPAFMPNYYPWQILPGTNMYGTSMEYDGQLLAWDRQGLSAMHGWKSG